MPQGKPKHLGSPTGDQVDLLHSPQKVCWSCEFSDQTSVLEAQNLKNQVPCIKAVHVRMRLTNLVVWASESLTYLCELGFVEVEQFVGLLLHSLGMLGLDPTNGFAPCMLDSWRVRQKLAAKSQGRELCPNISQRQKQEGLALSCNENVQKCNLSTRGAQWSAYSSEIHNRGRTISDNSGEIELCTLQLKRN